MSSPAPDTSTALLHRFRSDRKRLPLHPLEKAVLTAVAIHLCFLPWAIGTMTAWSQITSLGLSVVGFILALIPRIYTDDHALPGATSLLSDNVPPATGHRSPATGYRLSTWPRLLRFPLFWVGLALLAYLLIQGLNPSWKWMRNETHWWLVRVDNITWLPTSIEAPFARFNLWRQFIIYCSAWLTLCTVWIGFTRRRSLQLFLTFILFNALVLAVVGFAHRILSPGNFLGLYEWPRGSSHFASIYYKNHAGAFFALLTSLCVALALWTHDQGKRSGRKSTPAGLLVFCALLLTAAILASASRGATITVVIFLLLITGWFFFRKLALPSPDNSNRAITILITLAFAGTLLGTVRYLNFSDISGRFSILSKDPDSTLTSRLLAYEAGKTMWSEHGLRGTGAGSFRHLFPEYVKKHPEIYEKGKLFWEHIHRDWLQIPIELGLAGSFLLVIGAGFSLRLLYRHRDFWHCLAVPVLLGCTQTLIHAWFDFPFQCPAILITWLALVTVSARWLEMDGS